LAIEATKFINRNTFYFSYVPLKILQGFLRPFFTSHLLTKAMPLPLNWSILNNHVVRWLTTKILNLAPLVQISHPTQVKVKFPPPSLPGKAFGIKFPTLQTQQRVKFLGYAGGDVKTLI